MKKIRLIALLLAILLLFSGCAGKTAENKNVENEVKEEVNKFINSEPGRLQMGANLPEDAVYINCTDYEEYRRQIAQEDTSAGWLSWEQFSALGEFYSAGWWEGSLRTQYEYAFTDSKTNTKQIYSVSFDGIPIELGDISIKEYYQWYFGKDYVEVLECKLSDFKTSDLSKADHLSDNDGDVLYVSDDLRVDYSDIESKGVYMIHFIYDRWKVTIVRREENSANADIIRKLLNTETYKEAIAELMDPANGNYDK